MTHPKDLASFAHRTALPALVNDAAAPRTYVPAAERGDENSLDLRHLLSIMRRRFKLFAAVFLSVMAVVLLLTLLTPRQYRATAEVMLNQRNAKVTKLDDVVPALPAESQVVDTEVQVLKSRQLAEQVIRSLRLDRDPEFNPLAGSGHALPAGAEVAVADALGRRLSVSRSGLTYVIDVGFRSRDPAKAARIANEFVRQYLADQVEAKAGATRRAANWLSGRLAQLRGQVTADETAVEQFKIANDLMSANGATLTEQEISNYNEALAQANAQAAEDEARLETARRQLGRSGSDVGEAVSSPGIKELREQRAEVSRKVAELSADFRDSYPPLAKARSELADIDSEISSEIRRVISSLEAKAQVSRSRAAAIRASVGGAKGELAVNDRASVRLSELERNATASRSLYESYLARYKETSSQEGLAQPDAQLVSLAEPPRRPTSPKLSLALLLGASLASAAGLGVVALAELLDAGLATASDVDRRLNLRYLGAVPASPSRVEGRVVSPMDYLVDRPYSGFAEAFRSLTASILHSERAAAPVKTVAVTSALPGEGKTTVAMCLARCAALQGRRVVIVDCDLRRRSLNTFLPTLEGAGLLEVLAGEARPSEALANDVRSGADILPLRRTPTSPRDVFGSRQMEELLKQLRGTYDLVVLDTAPVIPVADSRLLARRADFVAVVARWRSTPYQAILGAVSMLSGDGIEVGGVILNRVDMKEQARHGYGDVAYYYTAYKHYYLDADYES